MRRKDLRASGDTECDFDEVENAVDLLVARLIFVGAHAICGGTFHSLDAVQQFLLGMQRAFNVRVEVDVHQ